MCLGLADARRKGDLTSLAESKWVLGCTYMNKLLVVQPSHSIDKHIFVN